MFIKWLKDSYDMSYKEFSSLTGWIREQIELNYRIYLMEVANND